MTTLYEFSNSSNWSLVWTGQKVAKKVLSTTLDRFYPIPDFSVPLLLDNPVLAIYVTSDTDPGTWVRAGYLKQKINTGLADGVAVDSYLSQKFLELRKINIVQLQKVNSSFAVEFAVPYWLRQIDVTVWEYTGKIANTITQQLSDLQSFITSCCDELTELSQTSTSTLDSRIGQTLLKLNDSEVLLNQISSAIVSNSSSNSGSIDEIASRLAAIESALNLLEDRTDFISDNLSDLQDIPSQFDQLNTDITKNNSLVFTQINQLDAGLFTLASSLGDLLSSDKKEQLESDIEKRLDLDEDFLI